MDDGFQTKKIYTYTTHVHIVHQVLMQPSTNVIVNPKKILLVNCRRFGFIHNQVFKT